MKKIRYACLLLGVVASFFTQAETLVIPGSGNPEAVLNVLAQAFNKQQAQHTVVIPETTGSAGALRALEEGTATLARIGRPLKDAEKAKGIGFMSIGRDAVVIAAGAAVTATGITRQQLQEVYTGKTFDWRVLGGKAAPIRAIGRESTDASRQAINREFPEFATITLGENVKVVHLDPQMIELLDRFPTSLGFLNRSALSAAKSKLVFLSFDGVEPTAANVETGRYPLWLDMGLIYKEGASPGDAARAFLQFLQSPAGVKIRRDYGLSVGRDAVAR